jgi:hypothetical protein
MSSVYKFLLVIIVFGLMIMIGYSSFLYLNKKIQESKTGWELAGYSLALLLINTGLFFGGWFVLIKSYIFLIHAE